MMYKYILNIILILSMSYGSFWVGLNSEEVSSVDPLVISSNIQETQLSFEFTGYYSNEVITSNGVEHIIDLEGGSSILELGAPDIDKYTSSIIIPDEGTTSIEVISSSYHDFYDVSIAPSKGNFSRMINPDDVAYEYGKMYQSNNFYPGLIAELQDPYIMRDLRGQTIVLYPLQYNPTTKTLRLYTQIELRVTTMGGEGINILNRASLDKSISREFNTIYQNMFLNYENDTRFDYVVDEGSMLIISYGDFIDEMQPLVDWKNRKGIPTEIIDVSLIGSSSNAIESYVDDYYHNNGLTYLLLVGDIAQMPSPNLSGSLSDPSYGFIDGNDSYAEILVGRFSGNNPQQISTQVERSIEYELDPQGNASWHDNALGVASNQGPGFGGMMDDDFNEYLWDTVLSNFTYDSYQGIYDGSGGTVSQGMTAINNGVGIINYTGHGWQDGWGNGAALDSDDVDDLENDNMLPFVITVGCNVGEFDASDAVFSEAWMRATNNGEPTGSIVHVGSTISQSWEPPMHGQYGMNLILTDQYENGLSRSIGGIFTNGCMYMNDAQGSSGINETNYWTFFGDPSVVIRTDQPEALTPVHDDVILIGQTEFVIDVGVNEGLVALSNDDGLISSTYVQDGVAVLSLDGMDMIPGTLDLVITSFNAFVYEAEISVISPDGAYLITTGYDLVSESGWDNMISYGDNVEIHILSENVGSFNTSAILVEVTSDDDYITITDGSSMIAYAIINETVVTENPISFTVAGNVPDGHTAHFDVLYDSGEEDQWDGSFSIEIHATDFQVLNPILIDEDQNGILDPGESATLTLGLANLGSADFMYYPGALLISNSEYIDIAGEGEYYWFYGIGAEDYYETSFALTASSDTPLGMTGTISIFWGPTNLSDGWCEDMINGCPDPVEFIYTISIGLPFDDELTVPGNLSAIAYQDYVELSWDQPILFDCDADIPYNDECAQYVVETDSYCCDWSWDSICEGAYQDCMGREYDISQDYLDNSGRSFQEFDQDIFDNMNSREITGYNVFRNNDFIGSTTLTVYDDDDISSSTEYCYYVTAMYDTGQSYGSEEACVTTMGTQGDANGDGSIDVVDVILIINMIFGLEDENLQVADLNGDGDISILDIIILVNIIVS